MKRQNIEHREQVAYMAWLRMAYPTQWMATTAVPLGGLRSKATAGILKAEGVKAGYPDILIDVSHGDWHGLRIEMKRQGATQSSVSKLQREWLLRLWGNGYAAGWAAGFDEARQLTEDYFIGTYVPRDWIPESWL